MFDKKLLAQQCESFCMMDNSNTAPMVLAHSDITSATQKPHLLTNGHTKKRGRPRKLKNEASTEDGTPLKQSKLTDTLKKTKRTVDRFKGVTKEELMQRLLPDRIKVGLDILIIGINPGLFAAYKGHHYAGPGNHFWKCINMSGLVDRHMNSDNDLDLLEFGIGFSTVVQRTTPSQKDLSSQEIREGGKELIQKIAQYKPKIAVFNGKGIYEIFSKTMFGQKKKDFVFGTQPNLIPGTDTHIFVMPSTSARCAQFPRAQDKVHFFIQMKRLRDKINGKPQSDDVQETNYSFNLAQATEMAKIQRVKEEKRDLSYDASEIPFPQPANHYGTAQSSEQPGCSKQLPINHDKPHKSPRKSAVDKGNKSKDILKDSTSDHPHLIHFLCSNDATENVASTSTSQLPPPPQKPVSKSLQVIPQLRQMVSEDQKNERVGHWVKTQIHQEYDSEPPMGFDSNLRAAESAATEQPGSDHSSQRSMVSAVISGSTSTGSTSGYGSSDTNANIQRDRVELWVREQQYVRQQVPVAQPENQNRQLQQQQSGSPVDLPPQFALENAANRGTDSPIPGFMQSLFPGASESAASVEGMFRPPVPLYSHWGSEIISQSTGFNRN